MKKFLSIAAVCAMAMVTVVSCKKTEKPEPTTPKVNVTVDKATIAPEAKATVTLTASAAVAEAVEFTLTSSDATAATLSSEKATIAKGEKTATVEVTGVKDGKTTIAAATTSKAVEMGISSVEITVSDNAPVESNIIVGTIQPYEGSSEFFTVTFPTEAGSSYSVGGLFIHTNTWTGAQGEKSLSMDNYGQQVVGVSSSTGIGFTAVEKDADMSSLTWIDNPDYNDTNWFKMPYINSPYMETPLTGEVYIALKGGFSPAGDDSDYDVYRLWIKLNVEQVLAANVSGCAAAICIDNSAPFKVGQTE